MRYAAASASYRVTSPTCIRGTVGNACPGRAGIGIEVTAGIPPSGTTAATVHGPDIHHRVPALRQYRPQAQTELLLGRFANRGDHGDTHEVVPYTFLAADALLLKVRKGGRLVNVHALLATGVNADGHREILGLQVTSGEDGAGWLAFFRDLTARGLSGVGLVTSDAHAGLVAAIGATLPGASWQRCRTHWSCYEST